MFKKKELTWPVKGLLIVDLLIRVQNSVQWQACLAWPPFAIARMGIGDGTEPICPHSSCVSTFSDRSLAINEQKRGCDTACYSTDARAWVIGSQELPIELAVHVGEYQIGRQHELKNSCRHLLTTLDSCTYVQHALIVINLIRSFREAIASTRLLRATPNSYMQVYITSENCKWSSVTR
jgi:hypothetical protein